MLVLTRKVGESITLTGGVVVRVTAIEGGRVRIGIEAPSAIKIARTELLEDAQRKLSRVAG